MPQCQFLFFAVFVFQKSYTGNILGIGRKKAEVPILQNHARSPEETRRGATGPPHHAMARAYPWPRRDVVWAPWASTDLALLPINTF